MLKLCKMDVGWIGGGGWRPGARTQTQPYQRLFRGDTHLEHSYPPPQAQCKASSGDTHTAFVIAVVSRTGKYAEGFAGARLQPTPRLDTLHAELWALFAVCPGRNGAVGLRPRCPPSIGGIAVARSMHISLSLSLSLSLRC